MENFIVTECKAKADQTIIHKGREYKIEGIRYIARHGQYFTNTSIVAEIWVTGKRKATYHGYIYKSGRIEIFDQNGSHGIHYRGSFGYDGVEGTTFAATV